jgi:PTS system cellobiose-specific IIA component
MDQAEQTIMGLISASGQSRSKAFEALQQIRKRNYSAAHQLLKESADVDVEAHNIQTKLIQAELGGKEPKPEINLLMVHAQDHYMTAQLARDLVAEMLSIFEERDKQTEE